MAFSARISSPLALGESRQLLLLGPGDLASVDLHTGLPGGYLSATISFSTYLDEHVCPPGAHIEIFWDGARCWEGTRRRPHFKGYRLVSIECAGYAPATMDANPWSTASFAGDSEQAIGADLALIEALGQAPLIQVGQPWGKPSLQVKRSTLDGRNPWDVMAQLATAAGYDFAVYDGRTATWQKRAVPDAMQYLVPVAQCDDYEPDDSSVFTRITATFTDKATNTKSRTQQFVDHEAEQYLGGPRAVERDAGTVDLAYASAWAQQQLRDGVTPTVRASIGPRAYLPDSYGGAVAGPFVKSGQFVQIGAPEEGRGTHPIVSTAVDTQGRVTAQLGERPLSTARKVAQVAHALESGSSIHSGGPS